MTQRFAGKVVLVTGAGSVGPGWGNGRAIAVGFAREGATVIGVDRNAAAMEETSAKAEEQGGRFIPVTGNVTESDSVAAIVDGSTCWSTMSADRPPVGQWRWRRKSGTRRSTTT